MSVQVVAALLGMIAASACCLVKGMRIANQLKNEARVLDLSRNTAGNSSSIDVQ